MVYLKKIMAAAAIAGAFGFTALGLGAGGVANAVPTSPGTSGTPWAQDDDGWGHWGWGGDDGEGGWRGGNGWRGGWGGPGWGWGGVSACGSVGWVSGCIGR